jgi:hypothetical protein
MTNPRFAVEVRSDGVNAISTRAGTGSLLRQYSGPIPAVGGGAIDPSCVLLCTHTMGSPLAPSTTNGKIVCTLPANVNAVATGIGSWARHVTSAGVFLGDYDLALSGMNVIVMNSLGYTSGVAAQVLQFDLTAGNA